MKLHLYLERRHTILYAVCALIILLTILILAQAAH